MKKILITTFYFFSRIFIRFLPYAFVYDWPERRIVFGIMLNKTQLKQFLASIWPINTVGGLKRYGTEGDGGYLLRKDITQVDFCFSAGIEQNSDYEFDIAEHFGCKIFMLDASVDGPAQNHKNFSFEPMWLGSASGTITYGVNEWIEMNSHAEAKDIHLKIDIEGNEYSVLDALSFINQRRLSVVVCEFHSFENILLKNQTKYRMIFKQLLQTHHVVHLHANNVRRPFRRFRLSIPTDLEVTFVRKDLIEINNEIVTLPNSLDHENTGGLPINLNWARNV